MIEFIVIMSILIFIYFMGLCIGHTILLIASFPDIIKRFDEIRYGNIRELIDTEFSLPVTIIMPAYNMGDIILDAVKSILASDYKGVNIIIVNDGSTDDTVERMIKAYRLYEIPLVIKEKIPTAKLRGMYESKTHPNLTFVDKEHHSAADSLNAGINACRTPVFVSFDADTIIDDDALTRIMFSFIAKAHCVIVGGAVYVSNDNPIKDGKFIKPFHLPRQWIAAVQVCEYFRSFLFGRAGWTPFGGSLCYAGAFTLFETDIVRQMGGYDTNNFSHDAEIVLHVHEYMRQKKYPYSVDFTPAAFSYTEVPSTLKRFWRQRDFWQRGLLRSFCVHRRMFFNPRYGIVGLVTYPFFLFFEIMAPVVEFVSYVLVILSYIYGILYPEFVLLFFALAVGYVAFLTVGTILLNLITFNKYPRWSDTLVIFFLSIAEMFFFRQYLSACTFVGSIRYVINRFKGKPW